MAVMRVGVAALLTRTRVVERLRTGTEVVLVVLIRIGESEAAGLAEEKSSSSVPRVVSERLVVVTAGRVVRAVIWCFVRNCDVMRMAFPNAGSCYPDELGVSAQVIYGRCTTVTHACA